MLQSLAHSLVKSPGTTKETLVLMMIEEEGEGGREGGGEMWRGRKGGERIGDKREEE